jgi:hypothetical protein
MHDDFAIEPIPGLPAHLPKGEALLWQGSPDWRVVALRVFHVRKIAFYFSLLILWQLGRGFLGEIPLREAIPYVTVVAALGIIAIALFVGIAWGIERTTIYSITSKRVVMRIGVALPVTFNIPFSRMEGAAVQKSGKAGDIALQLLKGEKIAYTVLWPHARPWHFSQPQPAFRGLADCDVPAKFLMEAFAAQHAIDRNTQTAQAAPTRQKPIGSFAPAHGLGA